MVLPFPNHDAKWDARSRKRLEYLIRHSTEHLTVGTGDCRESYISQNRYLVDHVFSKQQIYEAVWDNPDGDGNAAVTNIISQIRKKLNPGNPMHGYIRTILQCHP